MNEQIEKWISEKKAELAKQHAQEKADYLEKVGVIHKKWFKSEKDIEAAGLKKEDVVELPISTPDGRFYTYDVNPDSITEEEYQAILDLAGKDEDESEIEKLTLYKNVASIKKMVKFFTILTIIALIFAILEELASTFS